MSIELVVKGDLVLFENKQFAEDTYTCIMCVRSNQLVGLFALVFGRILDTCIMYIRSNPLVGLSALVFGWMLGAVTFFLFAALLTIVGFIFIGLSSITIIGGAVCLCYLHAERRPEFFQPRVQALHLDDLLGVEERNAGNLPVIEEESELVAEELNEGDRLSIEMPNNESPEVEERI